MRSFGDFIKDLSTQNDSRVGKTIECEWIPHPTFINTYGIVALVEKHSNWCLGSLMKVYNSKSNPVPFFYVVYAPAKSHKYASIARIDGLTNGNTYKKVLKTPSRKEAIGYFEDYLKVLSKVDNCKYKLMPMSKKIESQLEDEVEITDLSKITLIDGIKRGLKVSKMAKTLRNQYK